MKRDVGYALFAALSLMALTALYALVRAPVLADPKPVEYARTGPGSVPRLPSIPDNAEALERAVAVLETRDLFSASAPAEMANLRRLSVARIAPPVELTPVEDTPRQRAARRLAPPQPQQPPRQVFRPVPEQPVAATRPLLAAPRPQPPAQPAWTTPPVQAQPPRQPRPVVAPPPPEPPRRLQQALTQQRQPVQVVRDGGFPLTLRGVFPDPRTGGRAHVALPNGQVVSTGPGGVIEGFQVLEINAASIVVQGRGSPPLKLEMPGY